VIVDLPDTTASKISKALVRIREEGGAVALGRVLTLVISTTRGREEEAIEAANDASREHPMRVIVVSKDPDATDNTTIRLDAQIRVGGDAGASEVIVLKVRTNDLTDDEGLVMGLLLPDAPVVVWWPGDTPEKVSDTALGRLAQCRITDSAAQEDPSAFLQQLSQNYAPGDTDFAWTRLTLWRAQLAAVLDQPPYEPIIGVQVQGSSDSPSTLLLAAWLQLQLKVAVEYQLTSPDESWVGIHGVTLIRESGAIHLDRPHSTIATLVQPGQPVHDIALPRRSLRDCLAEELRRLDPDDLFGQVITVGLQQLGEPTIVHRHGGE
jgi:glucose-6-phosphate dehydrogenase assembly protein OpcA